MSPSYSDRPHLAPPRRQFARASGDESGLTLIEVLIAIIVLAIGLLAMAAVTGAVAMQTRMAGSVAGQTAAAQETLEQLHMLDFGALSPGTDTVTVNSHDYVVDYWINPLTNPDLKEVVVRVEGTRDLPPDTMSTLVADVGALPPKVP